MRCVEEKSQIQALDRTVPNRPRDEGRIEHRSHDHDRHGTSTLFSALDIATGQGTAAMKRGRAGSEDRGMTIARTAP